MNLLLTLGHNASTIVTDQDHNIVAGYEEERINRIKSSSQFPRLSIEECLKQHSGHSGNIYVSHWFDDFNFSKNGFSDKHWNPSYIQDLCESHNLNLVTLSPQFTHHDAHAWAALAFVKAHDDADVGYHICVADGFGNKEEVFSIYEANRTGTKLKNRVYGYENSLGLLYQYATSYCGMKENQDEYKFLGYETWVDDVLNENQIRQLQDEANQWVEECWKRSQRTSPSSNNSYIDVERLKQCKTKLWSEFDKLLLKITGIPKDQWNTRDIRKVIGHFVQCIIENYYSIIIDEYDIENIVVTGGLHYNVKLNNHILSKIPGKFCATPLAGDQGASIGLMYYTEGSVHGLESLTWGHRNLFIPGLALKDGVEFRPNHFYFSDRRNYINFMAEKVSRGELVNTVTGAMEFGPRALCNTSTLALPTEANVSIINAINGRDTVMPMAPVMLASRAHTFFNPDDFMRVVGSLQYMILTLDYHPTIDVSRFRGVMHPYPKWGQKRGYSGRPQLVEDSNNQPIWCILKALYPEHPAIINTSLNVHGVPIVYTAKDAVDDMAFNVDTAKAEGLESPILVIGDFE
jgi:predicted NodU family carbamoyl transferase